MHLTDSSHSHLEVYICGQICKETHGTYRVSMNELHFNNLLMEHIQPPPVFDSKADDANRAGFIEIGFPTLVLKLDEANSEVPLCLWYVLEFLWRSPS